MVNEYLYMKDLMRRFDITRDTVKYYEKKGLISSVRDKNGYRQYDWIMVKRLERIQAFRSMGYSLDEIKAIVSEGNMKEQGNLMFESRIREVERQQSYLASLKKMLEDNWLLSLSYEKYYWNCHRYDNFSILLESDACEHCKKNEFWNQEMEKFVVNNDDSVEMEGALEKAVFAEMILPDCECKSCIRRKCIEVPTVRGVLKMSESSRISELIREIYTYGEEQGYVLERKGYCFYCYYCEPGDEGVAMDIHIPILNAEDVNRS